SRTFTPFFNWSSGARESLTVNWTIYEDKNDCLWFAGLHDLVSYNKTTGKIQRHHLLKGTQPLTSVAYAGINSDNRGRYWAGSWGEGLVCFDPATDQARTFKPDPHDPNSISTQFTGPIRKDSKGNLYVTGEDGGFIQFNPVTEKFKVYKHN